MFNQKEMGYRLKALRVSKNMSRLEMGEAVGLSEQAIRKYEKGERLPAITCVIQYSEYFGISTDYILLGQLAPYKGMENR